MLKAVNAYTFEISTAWVSPVNMARPKLKTEATTLKMSPEVRSLWEQCAAQEHRSLTNMFEVMVRDHSKKLGIPPVLPKAAVSVTAKSVKNTKTK